jgi:hypothetical protein
MPHVQGFREIAGDVFIAKSHGPHIRGDSSSAIVFDVEAILAA